MEASEAVLRAILQTVGNKRFINQAFSPLSGPWTERSPLPATLYSVLARLPFRPRAVSRELERPVHGLSGKNAAEGGLEGRCKEISSDAASRPAWVSAAGGWCGV